MASSLTVDAPQHYDLKNRHSTLLNWADVIRNLQIQEYAMKLVPWWLQQLARLLLEQRVQILEGCPQGLWGLLDARTSFSLPEEDLVVQCLTERVHLLLQKAVPAKKQPRWRRLPLQNYQELKTFGHQCCTIMIESAPQIMKLILQRPWLTRSFPCLFPSRASLV